MSDQQVRELFQSTRLLPPTDQIDLDLAIRTGRRRRVARTSVTATVLLGVVAIAGSLVFTALPRDAAGPAATSALPTATETAPTSSSPTARSDLGEISYCVGTGSRFKSGQTVTVKFMRGSQLLGAPSIMVPMRVWVKASPGPFTVVVNDQPMLSGTIAAGQIASGSDGDNCPGIQ